LQQWSWHLSPFRNGTVMWS